MKSKFKYLLPLAVLLGVVFWLMNQPELELQVIHPEIYNLKVFVEEQAVTKLPHTHLVSMPINGWLMPISLREGDPVKKDQVVALLEQEELRDLVLKAEKQVEILESQIKETEDNRLEENALVEVNATVKAMDEMVSSSEASLKASKAVMDYMNSELGRMNRLSAGSAVTESELKKIEMQALQARAEYQSEFLQLNALKTLQAVSHIGPKFVKDYIDRKAFTLTQKRHQLIEAKTVLEIEKRNLSRSQMKAPEDSIVIERQQSRKQYLPAGTPILTLGNLEDLEIIAEVLTERAMQIKPGNQVDIFGEGLPDGILHGKVTRVYPAGFKKISSLGVEQQRVNVVIKLNNRPDNLGTGFRLQVRIFYNQSENTLTIPSYLHRQEL